MQDLDLDELDQAVNKIMDEPQKKRSGKRMAGTTAPALNTPAASGPASLAEPSAAVAASPTDPMREPTRVHVRRPMPKVPERARMRPGAMDIISPAPVTAAPPSAKARREAAVVTPTNPVTPESSRPVAPAPMSTPAPAPAPSEQPPETPQEVSDEVLASLSMTDESKKPADPLLEMLQPNAPAPTKDPATPTEAAWPDPLDLHSTADETPDTTPPKETPPTLEPEVVSVTDSHPDAGSSPFVTTKVEKRPLGAYANVAPTPAKSAEPAPPVPHETTNKSDLAEGSFESKHHLPDDTDMRNMTIPPQYHTAEQHPSAGVRHVFDTKEYHAPPVHMHATHKGSPWLVVVVVVLIVAIIAMAAVGYFMMTGTLDITKLW